MRLLLYSSVRKVFDYKRNFLQRALHASIQEDKNCFIEKLEGEDKGISIINLNRPSTKNAISQKLLMEFHDVIGKLRNES
ncbi:3301_t:CDS:2, partial [Racocetra persica]